MDGFQHDNQDKFTIISYHQSWPGIDPYHNFNPGEASARFNSYPPFQDPSGSQYYYVPALSADGGTPWGDWKPAIESRFEVPSEVAISISGSYSVETNSCKALVSVSPESSISGAHALHLVLVEDDLYYEPSYSTYDTHQNVMRDMITGIDGAPISLAEGSEIELQFELPIRSIFVAENCRLVAFVQAEDGSILNAATEDVTALPPAPVPFLFITETEVSVSDDDGDMKLNRGETAQFLVTIENECTWAGASNVSATLTSDDPYVTISRGTAIYGDIASCGAKTNLQSAFTFKVADDAPLVTKLEFNLSIQTQDGGSIPYIQYETNVNASVELNRFRYNFPIPVDEALTTGNAVVDLDGDGIKEIIICGLDSALHVFSDDGTELPGFPFKAGHTILGSPAVADIDNNGDLEIVIASNDKHVYVIQHDGSGASIGEALNSMIATPALDDLDNDGDLEIVIGSFGSDLLVLHHDGTAYSGFPLMVSGEIIYRGAAIADIDGDGNKDIVFGTSKGKIYAVDRTGANLSGFPVDSIAGSQHSRVRAPPIVTDIDGNGTLEIIVGQDKGVLSAVSNLGEVLWTHQIETGRIWTSAAVSDFDNNGTMETVYNTQAGHITVLDHLGADLTGWPQEVGDGFSSSPVITDLTGDGVPEIIVGTKSGELYAFYLDGTVVEDYPVALSSQAQGTATVADIDNNGWLEIVIGTDKDLTIVDSKIRSSIGYKWSTARGNLQRTGFYNPLLTSNDSPIELPSSLVLIQNYPNPFNAATTLQFGIPDNNPVRLRIFDALGQEVTQLVNSNLAGGSYSISWNGMNNYGELVETGIYFAKLDVGVESKVIKMILMK